MVGVFFYLAEPGVGTIPIEKWSSVMARLCSVIIWVQLQLQTPLKWSSQMGKHGQGRWDHPAEFRLGANFTEGLPITLPLHIPWSPSVNLRAEFLCSRNTDLKESPLPLTFLLPSPWNPLLHWRKTAQKLLAVAVQEQEGTGANGILRALRCQPRSSCLSPSLQAG